MQKATVVRLVTPSGLSRLNMPAGATFADLQAEVQTKTGVAPDAQRFALDAAGQRPINGAAISSITDIGISNGTQIHLVNKEASIAAQILTKVPVPVEPEQPVGKDAAAAASSSGAAAPGSAASSVVGAAPASSNAAASSSSVPKPELGDGKKVDPKFETFDAFLRNRRYDTAALPGNQKYKSAELKQGGQIKIPPPVSIKQQPYRHVDTLSVMNVPEMQYFVGYWQNHLLENGLQRMGWMYGYYMEDHNYDEGCRAVCEGIYEPPQEMMGEMATPKDDPNWGIVDRVADALGLERIGFLFTSLLLDDGLLLSPEEALKIGGLQNEHSTDIHFTKYVLSKFVSCAVRPDPSLGGMPSINPFMVSDQCAAMVRDGILQGSTDRRHVIVRDNQEKELISDFLVEGKPNKKILTDFFVVRVNDTAPKKLRSLFTHAEFPRENRQTHPQRRDDLKRYFKKRDNSEPSWSRFADFHLLLYIAQEIDIDTAVAICECVRERTEVPEGVLMIINQLNQ